MQSLRTKPSKCATASIKMLNDLISDCEILKYRLNIQRIFDEIAYHKNSVASFLPNHVISFANNSLFAEICIPFYLLRYEYHRKYIFKITIQENLPTAQLLLDIFATFESFR